MLRISKAGRVLVLLLCLSLGALVVTLTVPTPKPSDPPAAAPVDERDIAGYTGSAACAECHPREFQEHGGTYHAHTLRPASRAELGAMTPPVGPIPGSNNALTEENGKFYYEVNVPDRPDKYQLWPIDLAFGAGKHGITPVSLLEGRNVTEMKRSYFPGRKAWGVTPGKSVRNPAIGVDVHPLDESRACIGCHTVAMSKNAFAPRREMMGVGCESCHGPGGPHIAAMRGGRAEVKMERLARKTPEEIDILCGRCHALEKDVANSPVRQRMTYRFDSYAIMTSPCYLKSGKRLSCLNCHDPHQNARSNLDSYTPACLSCHSGARTTADTVSSGARPATNTARKKVIAVCPVNPSANCISCHMPKRDYTSATNEVSGILMTEHRIGIYR